MRPVSIEGAARGAPQRGRRVSASLDIMAHAVTSGSDLAL